MSTKRPKDDSAVFRQRDRDRLKVLAAVLDGKRTQAEAARLLGLTPRHVRRLLQRLEAEGDQAVIHGLRGRPSNRRHDDGLRRRVLKEYRRDSHAFAPTVAGEKPPQRGLHVGVETLRCWLIEEGLWQA